MSDDKQRREAIEHLAVMIAEIPVAMLTTCGSDHLLRSRPMVNINRRFQGDLWFFTKRDDPKVQEILGSPQVNVAFASPEQQSFVSVSGTGESVDDKKRREVLWTKDCERWFPEGPEDEELALIKIEVHHAEYWDAERNAMVRFAGVFKSLTGQRGGEDVKHERLDWESAENSPGKR